MKTSIKLFLTALSMLILSACSSGSDAGANDIPPASSSNWGAMVWGQDNWKKQ